MVVIDRQDPSFSLSESIRNKLNRKPLDLQGKIVSRAQKILSSKIAFTLGKQQYSNSLLKLKAKYGILKFKNKDNMQEKCSNKIEINDGIPTAKHIIFPSENIELAWSNQFKVIGSGLANLGNTCYLNSTLQCLTYTPPLANYVVKYSHCEQCEIQGFCMICEICKHIKFSLSKVYNVYKPLNILRNLKCIAKHFNPYKQEDAHEFFIHIIEALHNSGVNGYAKLDKYSKQTTLINQIFGGFLRSRVTCKVCHQPSDCYDPYVDISLDVKGSYNIQYALKRFVSPELIQNDNAYKCEKCKVKVPAIKQVTIHKPSNVCVLHLKRFTSSGHKINQYVEYPEKLNLTPYLSPEKQQGSPTTYQLYAVLVHSGSSTHYGHYYCFCKGQNGFWYRLDDANVSQISVANVLRQEAYILFYIKDQTNNIDSLPPNPTSSLQNGGCVAVKSSAQIVVTPFHNRKINTEGGPKNGPNKECRYKPALVPYPDSPPPPTGAVTSSQTNQREVSSKPVPRPLNPPNLPQKYSQANVGIVRGHDKVSFSLKPPRVANAGTLLKPVVPRPTITTTLPDQTPVDLHNIPLPQPPVVSQVPTNMSADGLSPGKRSPSKGEGKPRSPLKNGINSHESSDEGSVLKRKKKRKHKHKKHHKRAKHHDQGALNGTSSISTSPPSLDSRPSSACSESAPLPPIPNPRYSSPSASLYTFPYRKKENFPKDAHLSKIIVIPFSSHNCD